MTLTLFDAKAKDHESNILDCLMRGEKLTVGDYWRRFHSPELRHYIARIRKRGYNIVDKWVVRNGYRIKEYWIEK
jgi:hypothetical protein